MTQKLKNHRLATKSFLITVLMAATWISGIETASAFKFETLPSDKCTLQKIDPNPDPVLKCLKLKKGTSASNSEMQTVLDWCKQKNGTWTSDGQDGGSCQTRDPVNQQQKIGAPKPTPTNPGNPGFPKN